VPVPRHWCYPPAAVRCPGRTGDAILARVGGYVLGNVLTSIVAIIGNYIVLLALHVPYALPCRSWSGCWT